MATHEESKAHQEVKMGSERAFGLVFAFVFAIVALWPLKNGEAIRLWALAAAALFAGLAFLAPKSLAPLNRLWFKFGLLLHKIVNPLVMGLMFYLVFTPMGVAMRLAGKDLLRLKLDPAAKSYWIRREPPGPEPESLKYQF